MTDVLPAGIVLSSSAAEQRAALSAVANHFCRCIQQREVARRLAVSAAAGCELENNKLTCH